MVSIRMNISGTLQWRHNGLDGVSNRQPHHCLLSRLVGCLSKKTPKLRVTCLCAGISPGPVNSPSKNSPCLESFYPPFVLSPIPQLIWRRHQQCEALLLVLFVWNVQWLIYITFRLKVILFTDMIIRAGITAIRKENRHVVDSLFYYFNLGCFNSAIYMVKFQMHLWFHSGSNW